MRLPDWEARFAALVEESQLRSFKWGRFDCCTFAADAVEAVTGVDPMQSLRATYANWRSAARLVHRLGGLRNAVTNALDRPPLLVAATAQRGDVVLVRTKLPALGVVVGAAALVPLELGMQRVPMGDWVAGWRID